MGHPIMRPVTDLNKIIVDSNQGLMQLWNIRTQFVEELTVLLMQSTFPYRAFLVTFSFFL